MTDPAVLPASAPAVPIAHDRTFVPYPLGLALECFDDVINEGTHRGICLLQIALRVHVDGDFGDETEGAIDAAVKADQVVELIDRYEVAREVFYHGLSAFRYLGGDLDRAQRDDRQVALRDGGGVKRYDADKALEHFKAGRYRIRGRRRGQRVHPQKSCGQPLGDGWPRAIRSGTGRGGDVTGSRVL